jgi:hypothetical protein
MPLTTDQKKHLLVGGGISALALAAGYVIFGRRRTSDEALAEHAGRADALHDGRRRHHRHEQGSPIEFIENGRGEYGRRRHHHHWEHDRD